MSQSFAINEHEPELNFTCGSDYDEPLEPQRSTPQPIQLSHRAQSRSVPRRRSPTRQPSRQHNSLPRRQHRMEPYVPPPLQSRSGCMKPKVSTTLATNDDRSRPTSAHNANRLQSVALRVCERQVVSVEPLDVPTKPCLPAPNDKIPDDSQPAYAHEDNVYEKYVHIIDDSHVLHPNHVQKKFDVRTDRDTLQFSTVKHFFEYLRLSCADDPRATDLLHPKFLDDPSCLRRFRQTLASTFRYSIGWIVSRMTVYCLAIVILASTSSSFREALMLDPDVSVCFVLIGQSHHWSSGQSYKHALKQRTRFTRGRNIYGRILTIARSFLIRNHEVSFRALDSHLTAAKLPTCEKTVLFVSDGLLTGLKSIEGGYVMNIPGLLMKNVAYHVAAVKSTFKLIFVYVTPNMLQARQEWGLDFVTGIQPLTQFATKTYVTYLATEVSDPTHKFPDQDSLRDMCDEPDINFLFIRKSIISHYDLNNSLSHFDVRKLMYETELNEPILMGCEYNIYCK